MQCNTMSSKDVDLAACPLLQSLKWELGREDPIRHRDALSLQQFSCRLILRRVARGLVNVVASMEVVRVPRHELAIHTQSWPVEARDNLRRGIKQGLPDGRRKLSKAVHILGSLQGVRRHVEGQAQLHDHCRVEATDKACLILGPANLITHAARLLSPDLSVAARDRGHSSGFRVVALLCCVTWCYRHPPAALLVKLAAELCNVVLVRCRATGELGKLSGPGCLLRKSRVQVQHGGAHILRRVAFSINAFPCAVALHENGRDLILQDVGNAARWVRRDLELLERFVRRCLACTELRAREEVVHRLCICRRGANHGWLAQLEIHGRTVAHLLP
mmetsp:Transcript_88345/g.229197  ORF Transcript_88345/g.229197 Transcript_88345/m.229197 type:complete len:332 (-) Transcript_88345:214-1209(-)